MVFFFNSYIIQFVLIFYLFVYFILINILYLVYEVGVSFNFVSTNDLLFTNYLFQNFYLVENIFFFYSPLIEVYYFPFIYIFLFITLLSILFCVSYNFNELYSFIVYCFIILIFGFILFFVDSLILFFFSYEMLLLPSFFILYKYAKTRRCVEASYLMFFWTQFGAFFLIISFLYIFLVTNQSSFNFLLNYSFNSFEINFFFICWIIGFGVKFPIWPFYGWLPKAHVEASTNFSIFLSGVLVKFAFFGFLKCLVVLGNESNFFFVFPFILIGLIDSSFKLFYQIDLKKLIAFSTVVEMHWLVFCFISGFTPLWLAGFCMLISHAFLSTNSFLLVDSINRRFKTRLITEVSGLNFLCPKLFLCCLINCIIFLGFPGSIFFIAEFLFFTFIFDLYPLITFLLFILIYLFVPSFFLRSWMNVMFGLSVNIFKTIPQDLDSRELLLFFFIFFILFWFGFTWQSFLM